MITLNSSCTLEVLLGGVPVDAVVVVVDYGDQSATTYVRGQQRTKVSVGTAVTICDAPPTGTVRAINRLSVSSPNVADTTVDLMINDGIDTYVVGHAVLAQNEKVRITHDDEQGVNTADGSRKSGAVQDLSGYLTIIAAAAGYQPLDSDLTAIAALTTTSYGRAFLALADAAAGRTALALGTAAVAATGDFDAAGAAAAAQAASQPLDSDLTAIAALTTTTFGRAVLALADAAALRTAAGLGTLATQSGTFSGTSSGTNTGDQDLSGLVPKTTTVNGHALSANVTVSASDVSLGSVTNDAQTKAAIVPNTAPAAGGLLVGNAGGTAYAPVAASGDAAVASTGAITVTKTNGTAFGALATVTPGTGVATAAAINLGSAGALASLATAETFTAAQRGAIVTLTDASTIAWDLSLGNQFEVVLGGNRLFGVPTNIVAGQQGTLDPLQDATGSRVPTYAWIFRWYGGTAGVLSTAGLSSDTFGYKVDYYSTGTVTITIAAPGVVTLAAHGLITGRRCQLTTTGALPTGLSASTTYYVSVVDANTFKLCTSLANAAAGTFITTSGSQSGTHTIVVGAITLNLSKAAA